MIIDAVEALPADRVDPETIAEAEAQLIADARDHDAKALRVLGRRILDVVAPEIGEAHEAAVLEAEEREATLAARLTMVDDGHGKTHGQFTLPTLHAHLLRKHLLALAAPRHQRSHQRARASQGTAETQRRPLPDRLGRAFLEYVERYPADRLPYAGGIPATMVVTMPHETLLGGLKAAHLDTGVAISPSLARRLACEAGIIPAVLGGASQVLDLGRKNRFHNQPQRIALALEQGGCTALGCDWPPGMCQAHHDIPWHLGGHTNLTHGRLLCPRHHTLAHDTRYQMTRQPDGKVTFTRRT